MEEKREKLIRWFRNIQNRYPKIHINIDIHNSTLDELQYNKGIIIREIDIQIHQRNAELFAILMMYSCNMFVELHRQKEKA